MQSPEGTRADRRLWFAIACFVLGGPVVTAGAIWALVASDEIDRGSRRFVVLAILGLSLFAVGAGELVHRLRHGRQQPGRHVRPGPEQDG